MSSEDKILFEKIRNDDIKAFENIYKRYQPGMFAYSRKFIADNDVAKDILQEIFMDVWSKRKDLAIDRSISSFLFRMLHNRCIDYLRAQTIANNFDTLSSLRLAEVKFRYYNFEEDPFPTIFMSEINEIVNKTIGILPRQTQEIFFLSRNQGLKNSEIAEKLNLSVRTVENNIYQTLKLLKKQLEDYNINILIII